MSADDRYRGEDTVLRRGISRRRFLTSGLTIGAAATVGATVPGMSPAFASERRATRTRSSIGTSLTVLTDAVATGFDVDGEDTTQDMAEAHFNTFEGLVDYPTTLVNGCYEPNFAAQPHEFEPRLAESWTHNELTWTFKLRKGVKSALGNEFTADDVIYTFARAKSISGAAENSWFLAYVGGILPFITKPASPSDVYAALASEVRKIDDYTVRFHLFENSNFFFPALACYNLWIFDSKPMKKNATASDPWAHTWSNSNPVGFGPYKLSTFESGTELVYDANPYYYRGAPEFSTVTVKAIPEDANRIAAIEAGEADIVEYLAPTELKSLSADSSVSVIGNYTCQINVLFMNYSVAPWSTTNNKLLRQAVAYAIPYDEIISADYAGFGRRLYSLVPETFNGYYPDYRYQTDLDKARSLLAEAGFPNGHGLAEYSSGLQLYYVTERSALLEPIANRIQTNLAAIGMPITLQPIPQAEFTTRQLVKRDMPMAIDDDANPIIPDAGYVAQVFYQSPSAGGLVDSQNYDNAAFNTLTTESIHANGSRRLALLKQLQQMLMEDLPAIPLADRRPSLALRKPLSGWLLRNDMDVPSYWYMKS